MLINGRQIAEELLEKLKKEIQEKNLNLMISNIGRIKTPIFN